MSIWSQLVKEVFRAISLHLHDSDEKTRKLLLGKKGEISVDNHITKIDHVSMWRSFTDTLTTISNRNPEEFQKVFADQTDPPPCKEEIDELMKSIGMLKI